MKRWALLLLVFQLVSACTEGPESRVQTPSDSAGIVGGEPVVPSDETARKIVVIYITNPSTEAKGGALICTGSAIRPNVILTAAHCVVNQHSFVDVQTWQPNGDVENYSVTKFSTHPKFNIKKNRNPDLALLFLNQDLPSSVEILNLPPANENLDLKTIFAAGFGRTSGVESDQTATMGMPFKTTLNVTNYRPTAPFIEVDQSQGKGLCKGDSGGPGIISRSGKNYVVGIVKGGQPTKQEPLALQDQDRCNGRGYFLNLQYSDYLSWINSELSQP